MYEFVGNNSLNLVDVLGNQPALSYETVRGDIEVECDTDFTWQIKWNLNNHGKFGTIDQLVVRRGVIKGCSTGNEAHQNSSYVEFWSVNDQGVIAKGDDHWIVPIANNTCGWVEMKASAIFAASSVIPVNALTDPQRKNNNQGRLGSGLLPSVTISQYNQNNTPFSALSNMVSRQMKVWWNCCKKGAGGSVNFGPLFLD